MKWWISLDCAAKEVETYFTGLGIATLANKRSRAYVLTYWGWGARI